MQIIGFHTAGNSGGGGGGRTSDLAPLKYLAPTLQAICLFVDGR